MTTPRIGFVGLGAMGGAMAGYLVKSGYAVIGYDVSAARAEAARWPASRLPRHRPRPRPPPTS